MRQVNKMQSSSFATIIFMITNQTLGNELPPIKINIVTKRVDKNIEYSRNVNTSFKADIINENYTVAVYSKDPCTPVTISGDGLNGTYKFVQFHFHFPSQHSDIEDSDRFLEIYIVFLNTKYKNGEEGFKHFDGLLLVLTTAQITKTCNPVFNNLVDRIPDIRKDINHLIPLKKDINLSYWLPKISKDCYYGSVTNVNRNATASFVKCVKPVFDICQDQFDSVRSIGIGRNIHSV
ncbi:carbonic anhydrase 1-like [Zophobas morio]|uniref:carbonic anhydrase 1-like n=1 Tax=Zophobas morio TaxID=2755281 RepID=UPI003082F1B8